MTFEIPLEIFKEWGQKLAVTISAVMSASVDILCPKDVKEKNHRYEREYLGRSVDKELKQTSSNAEILKYKQIVEKLENKKNVNYKIQITIKVETHK